MSQWTHVNGIIRFDSLRIRGEVDEHKPDPGNRVTFSDAEFLSDEEFDKVEKLCNIPCGSEGSLDYQLYEDPDLSNLASYVLSIFGDLRDYDDEKEIVSYFNRLTSGKLVRSGIFEINVEYECISIYYFDINDECWKKSITYEDKQE